MIIVYLLLVSVVTLFLLVFLSFWQAVHPPKYISAQTPADFGWHFEEIALTTSDNLKLAAWFVPAKKVEVKSVIILLHGYPFDKGNLLPWTAFLHDDFNLLFFDFRYFGKSQGKFTSLGFYETRDVATAIEYLKKRGFEKIGLLGFSLGAAVALQTLPETDAVSAVVSDSAFANLDLLGKTYFGNFFFLKTPLTSLGKIYGRIFLAIEPDEVAPEKKVKDLRLPILIIHSKQDELITFEHAVKLKEALSNNPKAEFWFRDTGLHGVITPENQKEYENRVLNFFQQHL